MRVTSGPDGHLTTDAAPDFQAQARLTDYLQDRRAEGSESLPRSLRNLEKTLSKHAQVELVHAIHNRIAWSAEHAGELADVARWQGYLAQLARGLYAPTLPFTESDFTLMLSAHRRFRSLWSFGPEELLVAWLDEHELSPELASELRRFQADLRGVPGGMKYQSQAAYQVAVQHVHMLLWHDETDPLDANHCWSDRVRADYRAMTGTRKAAWRSLFRHLRGNAPAKPAKGWTETAGKLLAAVGRDEFADRFLAWFQPFGTGEPQRLEVAGSHVLRGLLWYAAVSGDVRLPPVALALLDTKWKAKKNVDKVMVALVTILETRPAAEAWPSLLRLQQEWPTTSVQVERFFKETAAGFGISEEELKARALLKPRLDIGRRAEDLVEKLMEARVMIRKEPEHRG